MKEYRGTREGAVTTVTVLDFEDGRLVYPLHHHVRHSPTGFEWGYGGSGPADLARSLLADFLGSVPHPMIYQRFKTSVVAKLTDDQWVLTSDLIDVELTRIKVDLQVECFICADTGLPDGPLKWCHCQTGRNREVEARR